jgi:hypothetical protein
MDLGTHIAVGVITASSWPSLDLSQRIIVVIFSILPDSFEWLHQLARKKYNNINGYKGLKVRDYNRLADQIEGHWYLWPYIFFHNIFTPTIFFLFSVVFHWSLAYSLVWFLHLLLDLPSHRIKLGLKLWWPFSQRRMKGFFDWWLVKFFQGWELFGYWVILGIICFISIRNFW